MFYFVLTGIAIVALAAWLLRPRRMVTRESWEGEDRVEPVDHSVLDAAEREVRGRLGEPEDEAEGDDWGPGTASGDQ